jgi:3-dehydroquinate dehydratase-1
MQTSKPIELKGQAIANGKFPLICTPLVGRTFDKLMDELDVVLPKQPDVLEWRVDFFEQIGDSSAVIAAARAIKTKAVGHPPAVYPTFHDGGRRENPAQRRAGAGLVRSRVREQIDRLD